MDFAKVTAEAAEQMQSQKGQLGYGFGGNQEVEFSAIMIQPGIGSEGMDGASAFDGIGDRNQDVDSDLVKVNDIKTSQTSSISCKL